MYVSSLAHVLSISGYHMAAGRGRGVLRAARRLALGAVAGTAPADQEMVRGRRAGRGRWLICCCRARRSPRNALLHHDGDRADRRDGRPACARRCARSPIAAVARAAHCAAVGGASELPDVVCRNTGADRDLRARLAVDVATPTPRAPPASRCGAAARSSTLVLASLVAGLATTPFAAYHFHRHRALWRARQSARHADRVDLGDAGGPAALCGRCRSALTARSGG